MQLSLRDPIPPLTVRQRQCLFFIAWYFNKHNMYPTQNEIARGLGLSQKTKCATGYVEALIKKKFLERSHKVKETSD
jgi:SOS-response transcriptional repressor LexA